MKRKHRVKPKGGEAIRGFTPRLPTEQEILNSQIEQEMEKGKVRHKKVKDEMDGLYCVCFKCHRKILPDRDFGLAVNPDARNGYRFACAYCAERGYNHETTYIYTAEEVGYHNEVATNPTEYAAWLKKCAKSGIKP